MASKGPRPEYNQPKLLRAAVERYFDECEEMKVFRSRSLKAAQQPAQAAAVISLYKSRTATTHFRRVFQAYTSSSESPFVSSL